MQVGSNTGRLSRFFGTLFFTYAEHFRVSSIARIKATNGGCERRNKSIFSFRSSGFQEAANYGLAGHHRFFWVMARASFSSGTSRTKGVPSEIVMELHDKMRQSLEDQKLPSMGFLRLMAKNCANLEDLKLIFEIMHFMHKIRSTVFRHTLNPPSKIRVSCPASQQVIKACIRLGAHNYVVKILSFPERYGLQHCAITFLDLMLYAKRKSDMKLMADILNYMNFPGCQKPTTTIANIVFSICYDMDNWELMCKYSRMFVGQNVKLQETAFDMWMEFAARRGDAKSIWRIERLRLCSMQQHTLVGGFSCAKGFLLERRPDDAADFIWHLHQNLHNEERPGIAVELHKLVSAWPLEVLKHKKGADKKVVAASLKRDISAMIHGLLDMGLEVNLNLEYLIWLETIWGG